MLNMKFIKKVLYSCKTKDQLDCWLFWVVRLTNQCDLTQAYSILIKIEAWHAEFENHLTEKKND